MTISRNLAFTIFGAYVALGPGAYSSGITQVNGMGYVRYENSPPEQSNPVYQLFQPSTQIDSGSAVAFILLTNSL